MPSTSFRYRLLTDKYFVRWLIGKDKRAFLKLTHIKASSIECRKEHNVIVEEEAIEIINEGLIKEHNLRAAFKGQNLPSAITKVLSKEHDQKILFAMILSTEKPFFTYILTTKEHLAEYQNSSHYKNVKSISVKAEEEALKVIDTLWNEFCLSRNTKR